MKDEEKDGERVGELWRRIEDDKKVEEGERMWRMEDNDEDGGGMRTTENFVTDGGRA